MKFRGDLSLAHLRCLAATPKLPRRKNAAPCPFGGQSRGACPFLVQRSDPLAPFTDQFSRPEVAEDRLGAAGKRMPPGVVSGSGIEFAPRVAGPRPEGEGARNNKQDLVHRDRRLPA
jgi:hypothetical protein